MFPDRATDFFILQLGRAANQAGVALRAAACALERGSGGTPVRAGDEWLRHGAAALDRCGAYFECVDGVELLCDLEGATQEHPWVVGLAALCLGLTAGRALKSAQSLGRDG